MRDYLTIGCSPVDENCVQVTSNSDYLPAMKEECRRFKQLLLKTFGEPPEGADLAVKSFSHDFGIYCEVVCYFDDTLPESVEYAFNMEANVPETWDADTMPEGIKAAKRLGLKTLDQTVYGHYRNHNFDNWYVVFEDGIHTVDTVNFESILKQLEAVSKEHVDTICPNSGDYIIVSPESPKAVWDTIEEIQRALEDYPVLDDMALSDAEFDAYMEAWDNWARDEKAGDLCREFELSEAAQELIHESPEVWTRFYFQNITEGPYEESDRYTWAFADLHVTRKQVADFLKECRAEK